MIKFRLLRLSKTNCYLFPLPKGYLLLDCGYEQDQNLMETRLREMNVRFREIRYLMLTHHHDDHSGLCNHFVAKNPEIQIIMHQSCKEFISKGENNRAPGGGWCSPGTRWESGLYRKLKPDWTLQFPPYSIREEDILLSTEQDDILSSLGLDLKILFTPGHTEDSISLLDSKGNLFCGDSASNFLKWTGTKYTAPYISDLKLYYRSWEKMLDANAARIYPSHGKSFPAKRLRENINGIKKLSEFTWD